MSSFARLCWKVGGRTALPPAAAKKTASPPAKSSKADPVPELTAWLEERKAQVAKVGRGKFHGIRGLAARTAIAAGEDVAFVPRSCAIWTYSSAPCPFPDWIDAKFFREASLPLKLALCLLHERSLADKSQFAWYIATLPTLDDIDLPATWPPEDVEALRCPFAVARVTKQRAEWDAWWEGARAAGLAGVATREQFFWALSCVSSRGFKGPHIGSSLSDRRNLLLLLSGATALTLTFGLFPEQQVLNAAFSALFFNVIYEAVQSRQQRQQALVPLIDLANWAPDAGSDVTYSYFQDGFLAEGSDASVQRGDEVFVSYGAQTTDSLLRCYGFVAAGGAGAADVYTLVDVADALVAAGAADAARAAEVREALARVPLTNKAQVPDEAKVALRYATGAAATLDAAAEKQSNKADAALWRGVAAVVDAELQALGKEGVGSLEKGAKDAAKLGDSRRATIQRYLAQQKSFLQARAAQLKSRIAKMEGG